MTQKKDQYWPQLPKIACGQCVYRHGNRSAAQNGIVDKADATENNCRQNQARITLRPEDKSPTNMKCRLTAHDVGIGLQMPEGRRGCVMAWARNQVGSGLDTGRLRGRRSVKSSTCCECSEAGLEGENRVSDLDAKFEGRTWPCAGVAA
jgi:hypothetical protein